MRDVSSYIRYPDGPFKFALYYEKPADKNEKLEKPLSPHQLRDAAEKMESV